MPARSPSELTTWRTSPHTFDVYVYIHAPATVFAARVNQASFSYPITVVTFDTVTTGAYTDIEEGMTMLFGSTAGADDLGRVRVKKTNGGTVATSTQINFGRASRGFHDGEVNLSDNAYITVLNLRQLWATPPRITDSGTIYKDGDITFGSNKSMPPVANAGPDALKIVASALDTALFDFGQTPSFTVHPDADGTLTYDWDFIDATPPTSTDAAPTGIEFPVGARYIKLTVEDSLGSSSSAWALVVVADKNHANLLKRFTITRHSERADGQNISLRVDQSIPANTYPDGTEVLIAKRERGGSTVTALDGPDDRENMVFAGWIQQEDNEGEATNRGFIGRTTLTLVDAAGSMKALPGWTQAIERDGSPSSWYQLKKANLDRYAHHLWRWHSTADSRVDFTLSGTGETYAFPTFSSDGGSLYDQIDMAAQAIRHKLTCDPWGRMAIRRDPIISTVAQRTSTVIASLLKSDWSRYRYSFTRAPRYHWNWGEALVPTATDADRVRKIQTVFCVAPGSHPGQGVQSTNTTQQLATQSELNEVEGHRYAARMNAMFGALELDLSRPGDAGIRPAYMEWVQTTIDSDTVGPRGRVISAQKYLPIEVRYSYNQQAGTRSVSLTLEKEVQGTAAKTYVPKTETENPNLPSFNIPDIAPAIVAVALPSGYGLYTGRLCLVCNDKKLRRTSTFFTPAAAGGPTWDEVDLSGSISGTPVQWCVDASNSENGWLVTTTNVYYLTSIFAVSPGVTSQLTLSDIDGLRISLDFDYLNSPGQFGVLVYGKTDNALKTRATTDGGATWGSEVEIGPISGLVKANMTSGVAIDPHASGTAYTFGYTAPDGVEYGRKTTHSGGAWSTLSGWVDGDGLGAGLIAPYADPNSVYYTRTQQFGDLGAPANSNSVFRGTRSGSASTDITPLVSSVRYGGDWSKSRFTLSMPSNNKNLLLVCGVNFAASARGLFLIRNASSASGTSTVDFLMLIEPAAGVDYARCALTDQGRAYVWGNNLAIGYSESPLSGEAPDDRRGNLAGSAEVLGIAG